MTESVLIPALADAMVRVTEITAIAASKEVGRGQEKVADQAAVDAMRTAFNAIDFRGRVVIGEGERDEA
ncbi:MAG: fructose-bisphosphatase class II, partial [Pseudomonadota bacterium]